MSDTTRGQWDGDKTYFPDNTVEYEGEVYKCLVPTNFTFKYENIDFDKLNEVEVWNNDTTYEDGDFVIYDGVIYRYMDVKVTTNSNAPSAPSTVRYKTTGNIFNDEPDISPIWLEVDAPSEGVITYEWTNDTSFYAGDIVSYNNKYFKCLYNTENISTGYYSGISVIDTMPVTDKVKGGSIVVTAMDDITDTGAGHTVGSFIVDRTRGDGYIKLNNGKIVRLNKEKWEQLYKNNYHIFLKDILDSLSLANNTLMSKMFENINADGNNSVNINTVINDMMSELMIMLTDNMITLVKGVNISQTDLMMKLTSSVVDYNRDQLDELFKDNDGPLHKLLGLSTDVLINTLSKYTEFIIDTSSAILEQMNSDLGTLTNKTTSTMSLYNNSFSDTMTNVLDLLKINTHDLLDSYSNLVNDVTTSYLDVLPGELLANNEALNTVIANFKSSISTSLVSLFYKLDSTINANTDVLDNRHLATEIQTADDYIRLNFIPLINLLNRYKNNGSSVSVSETKMNKAVIEKVLHRFAFRNKNKLILQTMYDWRDVLYDNICSKTDSIYGNGTYSTPNDIMSIYSW